MSVTCGVDSKQHRKGCKNRTDIETTINRICNRTYVNLNYCLFEKRTTQFSREF